MLKILYCDLNSSISLSVKYFSDQGKRQKLTFLIRITFKFQRRFLRKRNLVDELIKINTERRLNYSDKKMLFYFIDKLT